MVIDKLKKEYSNKWPGKRKREQAEETKDSGVSTSSTHSKQQKKESIKVRFVIVKRCQCSYCHTFWSKLYLKLLFDPLVGQQKVNPPRHARFQKLEYFLLFIMK